MRRACPRLLIQDEIEDTEMPDIAASAWTFEVWNVYGDCPQGRKTDNKSLWMSAGWFQHKVMEASMSQSVLTVEHRSGDLVASLIRTLFPDECSHVHASVNSPQSIIVPHLIPCETEWRTDASSKEELEHKEVYGDLVLPCACLKAFGRVVGSCFCCQWSCAWGILRPSKIAYLFLLIKSQCIPQPPWHRCLRWTRGCLQAGSLSEPRRALEA